MYNHLITQFNLLSILVIGDMMTDRYLKGSSTRLSPEAPVPVVDIHTRTDVPGGAANTAINLRLLGASVTFCSVTGADEEGMAALQLLEQHGITTAVYQHPFRQTIVKTRVQADGQLLTRYDCGTETPLTPEAEAMLCQMLEQEYPRHDAVVIADYNKGLLTPAIIQKIEELQAVHTKLLAVDAKKTSTYRRLRPSLVKPNYTETLQLTGLAAQPAGRCQQVKAHGAQLHEATGADIVAVTLDEEGAVVFHNNEAVAEVQAPYVPHPNVVGAGDVYIGAFTLARAAGATIPEAANIAGAAAAVAVTKTDTAHCRQSELEAHFSLQQKVNTGIEQVKALTDMYRAQGKKVVFTNGCFDILHSGHVSYLERARALGHVLIVGINTDESIRRLKGSHRPINNLQERMQVLAGLEAVTHLVPFGKETDDTPAELITAIRPQVFVKGGDYTREELPEAALVEAMGGSVEILPLVPGRSTSLVIRKISTHKMLKTV
ncbi:D-glycero-beta-D-manno-heptose 1-phosphate adenylyltransferase [Chitinophaga sp.]|uniref:D-glycero-beta-D-manno-heptose 1-phosphate adenylyltransferase n=1 Tax=Chitinophaga sp. TaxID=1869181 RepID=UPI0031D986F5